MNSHAIYFTGPRQAEVVVEDVAEPGKGQVLLESIVSLISTGTESWCYRGEFDADTGWANWVKYPFRPGYSTVGRVVKVGAEVTGLAEGDRVFSQTQHMQYTVTSPGPGLIRLPETAASDDASWGALSFITQTGVRRAEHHLGDTAVVIGLGLLGQLVTQYLRASGLQEILCVDTAEPRLKLAEAHGATATFQGTAEAAVDFVREHTGGRLADVVYDVTGHWAVLPKALKLARDFGTLLLLGDTPHPSKQVLTHDVLTRQVKIVGTHNAKLAGEAAWWTQERQVLLFLELIRRGQMRVADLVTHRFSPLEAPKVYELLQEQRDTAMGVLFDWAQV